MKLVDTLDFHVIVRGKLVQTMSYSLYTVTNKKFYASAILRKKPIINSPYTLNADSIAELKKMLKDKWGFAYTYGVSEKDVKFEEC